MDVARRRLRPALEWLVAAAFLIATLAVASMIVQELRAARPSPSTPAAEVTLPPPSVPPRAISVPVLLLLDGKQLRLGDTLEQVSGLLGRSAEMGTQEIGRGALGERLTRHYDHAGTRFILVFEPFELNGRPRVAGIYIQ
ncbi:MAG: hypothetical protein HY654_13155 [Acidobacteria bacterium]|nr:hypothetical protein [Acidobacteriota bacterium]